MVTETWPGGYSVKVASGSEDDVANLDNVGNIYAKFEGYLVGSNSPDKVHSYKVLCSRS